MISVRDYNRQAWNDEVERNNPWTVPVSSEIISGAREGHWQVLLTENKPVPRDWFPELKGIDVLCLASGGGQQAPIFAAAGANVTVLDNSPRQLEQDRYVAERENLNLITVEGDMADLSHFGNESFDLIFHPCSNCFIPDVRPVWAEAYRVARHGGLLLAGFNSPVLYIIDRELEQRNVLQIRHRLPYSDLTSLDENERRQIIDKGEPLEFGHTLSDLIGGQTDAGFVITDLYEDHHRGHALANYTPTYIATRAKKL